MLDDYEFVKLIGRGAFGEVFFCKRKGNSQKVVIKKISSDISGIIENGHQSADPEVKVLAMLNHPNVLEYYENFVENMGIYIVMEYAPGGNLYDYLQSKGKSNYMAEDDVLNLFCQLAAGIQHIHKRQILHRDLKTHNVMLDRTQRIVKIGDFGISKILESKSKAHSVVGTPCYLSPELCRNQPYNQKSDIWALGCVLYEMLSLQMAFQAESLAALIPKIMRGRTPPIPSRYSSSMKDLVTSLLNIESQARPDINQVISNPLVFPTLFRLFCDLGKVRFSPLKAGGE